MHSCFVCIQRIHQVEIVACNRCDKCSRWGVCGNCRHAEVEEPDSLCKNLGPRNEEYRGGGACIEIRFGIGHGEFGQGHCLEEIGLCHDPAQVTGVQAGDLSCIVDDALAHSHLRLHGRPIVQHVSVGGTEGRPALL